MSPASRASPEHLLTIEEFADLLRVSKRTVGRWVAQGRLPAPVRYSKTCVRWKASDVQAYLESLPCAPQWGERLESRLARATESTP
jgi:excisionase family DNA binding protein